DLLLASVAVRVTLSATVSFVLIVNVPLESVFLWALVSAKVLLPSLSNCPLPVLLVIVTCVALSVVTVLLKLSLAVTVTLKAVPAVCDDDALTVYDAVVDGVTVMLDEVPVLLFASVAVKVRLSATVSFVLMVNVPLESVFL